MVLPRTIRVLVAADCGGEHRRVEKRSCSDVFASCHNMPSHVLELWLPSDKSWQRDIIHNGWS